MQTTPIRGVRAVSSTAGPARPDSDITEAALAVAGDESAFERLYRKHVNRIHALACRMLSRDEADEATQDVFVRAWRKLGSFRGEAAFGTWLHRLAVNELLGRRKALGIQRERYTADDRPLELMPAKRHVSVEHTLDFEAAIERLPDGARQVFVLHDVEGYRHEEIAEMMGTVAGTSKSQLHRARMALRQHLDR